MLIFGKVLCTQIIEAKRAAYKKMNKEAGIKFFILLKFSNSDFIKEEPSIDIYFF
ncbi:hypothetical protein TPHV1_50090 [Treponema phagedenis]|uniref:Uncharacterized protein n=1 Tax=Treponema phagedenis TaxID=162 RepID=A0A0B7H0Q3_TREPH|nr:hypothetical protein TPHV1_50090 [Treponema phagedenis]